MTPAHRAAESFGFWGLVYKLAGVCVIGFGLVKDQLGDLGGAPGTLGVFRGRGARSSCGSNVDRGAANARP